MGTKSLLWERFTKQSNGHSMTETESGKYDDHIITDCGKMLCEKN